MDAVCALLDSDSFDGWIKCRYSIQELLYDNIEMGTRPLILTLMGVEPRLIVISLEILEYESIVSIILYHQQNFASTDTESIRISGNYSEYLFGSDWLPVFTQMKMLTVYHVGNLLSTHSQLRVVRQYSMASSIFIPQRYGILQDLKRFHQENYQPYLCTVKWKTFLSSYGKDSVYPFP